LPFSLRVDGKWWHDDLPKVEPVKAQRLRNRVDVTAKVGDFVITTHYQLLKGFILQKSVTVRYEGEGKPKVDGVLFLLPYVVTDVNSPEKASSASHVPLQDAVLLSPSFDFLRVPVSQRTRFSVDMGTGVWCALHSPSQKLGIATTFYSETEHYSVNAEIIDSSVSRVPCPLSRFSHWLGVQDRVFKGWTAELGTQFLIVAEGDERTLLERIWDAYDAFGLKPLPDTPKDAFDGAFYEPAVQHTYRNIVRLLPHLKHLGVKTIWLTPYTPGIYAPLDYFAIRQDVGTAEDLKLLVAKAHRLGMRVLLDLIPHGPRPESELGKEQRAKFDAGQDSWICADEQGRPIHWWGCYAFDYAHPGWINYMAKVAEHFAREFGIDGWRVDVAHGGPPNWRWAIRQVGNLADGEIGKSADGEMGSSAIRQISKSVNGELQQKRIRPSQSGLWGALQILREARKAVKRVRNEAVFYPEASGAPYVVNSDFDYGFPFQFVAMRLMGMTPEEFVPKLRKWLQHQRYSFPKGGSKRIVRWLANHDFPDVQSRLGFGYSKAMFAVCAVSEGVPFIYEDQDLGLTDFIARLMQLRLRLTELRDGDADYLSVQVSDNSIFAVHRFAGNRSTVALVNLSGETKTVKVKLPEEWDRGQGTRDKAKRLHKNASGLNTSEAQVGDAWSGKVYPVRKGIVTLTLQPFEVALLTDVVRARKFALKTENQKAGFPVSQTSPEFRSGSSPTLRVTSASKPVSLSDEGFMSAGKVLTGQWHEGEFKIAPGERMPFEVAEVQRNEKGASGKLAIKRKMGATVRTVAEILWSWTRDKKLWRYEAKLQVKLPIKLARHDLAWQFNFVKPKRWRISTVEGVMEEQTIVRHERPQLILDSSKVLLSPTDSPICVQLADGNWWTLTEWRGANLQVRLQPDETLVVRIAPDDQNQLSFSIALDTQIVTRPSSLAPRPAFSSIHAALQTSRLRLTVSRSLGGLPIRMEVRNMGQGTRDKSEWQTVLIGSELYSDYGIFPDHDEGGAWRAEGERRTARTVGRASNCRYPDKVEMLSRGIAFEGALATTWGGHWWHLSPRINYRLHYEIEGDGIVVQASVEPVKPMRKVRAFLALTLTFVGVEKVLVNTLKGWHEVSEIGERDWQSRHLPLNPNDPQIQLHTKAGTIALKGIAGDLQNCFVLKDGDRCTVFFAWLDGELTDFAVRSVRFNIE
ncbi:MAG: alpha-amylase family glycosyl hydrolase, partial [Armatimonadetes bacterium]|nr:alpha-amylase family glycosyl hydrolase [Armatimonadota bacterium]